jgi:hypothetical protein
MGAKKLVICYQHFDSGYVEGQQNFRDKIELFN